MRNDRMGELFCLKSVWRPLTLIVWMKSCLLSSLSCLSWSSVCLRAEHRFSLRCLDAPDPVLNLTPRSVFSLRRKFCDFVYRASQKVYKYAELNLYKHGIWNVSSRIKGFQKKCELMEDRQTDKQTKWFIEKLPLPLK